jgi:hypothetical protein
MHLIVLSAAYSGLGLLRFGVSLRVRHRRPRSCQCTWYCRHLTTSTVFSVSKATHARPTRAPVDSRPCARGCPHRSLFQLLVRRRHPAASACRYAPHHWHGLPAQLSVHRYKEVVQLMPVLTHPCHTRATAHCVSNTRKWPMGSSASK